MNAYQPTSLASKLVIGAATVVIGLGILHLVAGGMTHPDPQALATRQQFIAAEAERAQKMRELARGEVRYAVEASADER